MSEQPIDLGDQRLSVGAGLGDEFVRSLESDKEDNELANKVKQHLIQNPGTIIVGAKVDEDGELKDVLLKLNFQVGLPESMSSWRSLGDKLEGRESDYLLVISGLDNLSKKEQKELKKRAKKLKIPNILGQ